MAKYQVKDIQEKILSQEKASVAEQTIMTRGDMNPDMVIEGDVEDAEAAADEAVGFGGWFRRLFAKKIEFQFHNTPITGKSGFQVRGGAVPLFPGVTLDLTPANMKGVVDSADNTLVTLENGGKPQLVVTPTGTGHVQSHKVDEMVLQSDVQGQIYFWAAVNDQVEYESSKGKLTADSMNVTEWNLSFNHAKVEKEDGSEKKAAAIINQEGLHVATEEPPIPPASRQEKEVPTPPASRTEEAQPEQLPRLLQQMKDARAAAEEESEDEEDETEATGPVIGGHQIVFDPFRGDLGVSNGDLGVSLNVIEGTAGVSVGDDFEANINVKEGTAEASYGDVSAGVNVKEKTFHLDYDTTLLEGGEDEPLEDEESGTPIENAEARKRNLKRRALKELRSLYMTQSEHVYEKLGLAKEDEAMSETSQEGDEGSSLDLKASIPLFPGVSFTAAFIPAFSFGVYANASGAPKAMEEKEDVEGEFDEETETITFHKAPNFDYEIQALVGLRGFLRATLKLGLEVGFGYLANLAGNIFAKGSLEGTMDSKNTFARAMATMSLKKQNADSKPEFSVDAIDLNAMAALKGTVGAELLATSKLFNWSTSIWDYTFEPWNIADLDMGMKMEPKEHAGNDLKSYLNLKNWQVTNSYYDVGAFGARLKQKKNMGIIVTQNDEIKFNVDRAKQSGEELQKTINQLKEIRDAISLEDTNFAAPNSEKYQELLATMNNAKEYLLEQIRFGERRIGYLEKDIASFLEGKQWKENSTKTQAAIDKHQGRIDEMKAWSDSYGTHEGEDVKDKESAALQKYEDIGGGSGFSSEKKNQAKRKVISQLATRQQLLEVSKKQYDSATKKHRDRLTELKKFIREKSIRNLNVPNEEFVSFYRKLGASELFEKLGEFNNEQGLLKFAKFRRDRDVGAMEKRLEDLRKAAENCNVKFTDDSVLKPNPEFWDVYCAKPFNGRNIEEHLWDSELNSQKLIDFEITKMQSSGAAKKVRDRIETVKNARTHLRMAKTDKEKAQAMQEATSLYDKKMSALKDLKSITSIEDIFSFEKERSEGNFGSEDEKTKLKKRKNSIKQWAASVQKDALMGLLSLETIYEYENAQAEKYAKKGSKEEAFHRRMAHLIEERIRTKSYAPEEVKTIIEEAKDEYRQGYKDAGSKMTLTSDITSGDVLSDTLTKDMHRDRLEQLRSFMGLSADSDEISKSKKDDAQVAYFYFNVMEAGDGVLAKVQERTQGQYSLEDMLRHEQYMLYNQGKDTRASYDRLQMIKEKTSEHVMIDGLMMEKESPAEVLKTYMEMGGSSSEYNEYLLNQVRVGGTRLVQSWIGNVSLITPRTIFNYEEATLTRLKEHSDKQIQIVEEGIAKGQKYSDIKSNFKNAVLESQKTFSEQHLQHMGFIRLSMAMDFENSMDPNKTATPQMILNYEQERVDALGKPYRDLENAVQKEETNESAWNRYKEMGGESGFLDEMKAKIKEETKAELNRGNHYESILSYENTRLLFYQERMKKVKEPLEALENARNSLEKQVREALDFSSTLGEYDPQGKKAFSSAKEFGAFVGQSTTMESLHEEVLTTKKDISEQEKLNKDNKAELEKAIKEIQKSFEETA